MLYLLENCSTTNPGGVLLASTPGKRKVKKFVNPCSGLCAQFKYVISISDVSLFFVRIAIAYHSLFV